jgi:hypothetical protein
MAWFFGRGAAGMALAAPVRTAVAIAAEREHTRRFLAACRTAEHVSAEQRRAAEAAAAAYGDSMEALAGVLPRLSPAAQVALARRLAAGLRAPVAAFGGGGSTRRLTDGRRR